MSGTTVVLQVEELERSGSPLATGTGNFAQSATRRGLIGWMVE
jgi:hypothetical protein